MAPDLRAGKFLAWVSTDREPWEFLPTHGWRDAFMILYALRFFWTASRGYRLRPWRSPYLRWRMETFSGIPAEEVTFRVFWKFLWKEGKGVRRFLKWGAEMRRLEKRSRREADPSSL